MINTTQAFVDAIYNPIRATKGRVTFKIVDVEAMSDATPIASGEATISRITQIVDDTRKMDLKYATFENDYFKLDGSFKIPPKNTDSTDYEVGWWSNELSDSSGMFTTHPTVQITFTALHSSVGISLTFDALNNQYPTYFDVSFYDASNNVILNKNITGHDSALYTLIEGITGYNKIIITFLKTSAPYRRVRLVEVDFGIIKTYENSSLVRMNLIEEMSVTSNEVTSNEFNFTIDNSEKAFNISTPTGFYKYLQERQEVIAELGVELSNSVEFVPLGKFYLKEWKSDEGSLTTTFTARDIFDLMSGIESPIGISGTLYSLAEGIIIAAGVINYYIDPKLTQYSSQGFVESINSRAALQMIGIASKSAVYQDRYGVLTIKQLESIGDDSNYLIYCGQSDLYSGTFYPLVDGGFKSKTIDLDNMYATPQIKMESAVKYVSIITTLSGSQTEYIYENAVIDKGVTVKLENILINTEAHAAIIAQWLLDQFNQRAIYEINWRQNPALECGDVVIIEDGFGTTKQSRLLRQEFEYTGYLSGRSQAKGGV